MNTLCPAVETINNDVLCSVNQFKSLTHAKYPLEAQECLLHEQGLVPEKGLSIPHSSAD